jgi:hypothetical protein
MVLSIRFNKTMWVIIKEKSENVNRAHGAIGRLLRLHKAEVQRAAALCRSAR